MNEIPVIIKDGNLKDAADKGDKHHPVFFFNEQNAIRDAFERVESGVYLRSLTIIGEDAKEIRNGLFRDYTIIDAAGGVVVNQENKILMIYRHSMWDLPKGKLEIGELPKIAAVREVEEETGIGNIKVVNKLLKTYHTYFAADNQRVLKRTYWYLMQHSGKGKLKPQVEEGIEAALWVDETMLPMKMDRTYGTIRDVMDKALLMLHPL